MSSDEEEYEVLPPSPKRAKVEKKVRGTDTDAYRTGGKGVIVVHADEPHVQWRTVPGFPPDRVHASRDGRVWAKDKQGVARTTRGSINKTTKRARIHIDGVPYLLHQLVCRAFRGPPPTRAHTVDHGNNGVFEGVAPDVTDNRARNLRWATRSQQNDNQKKAKSKRTGKPIWVRRRDWDEATPWMWFESKEAARKATGADNLHTVANGKYIHSKGWIAAWADARETQDNLPGEEWVDADGSDGRAKVSSMGRAWSMICNSTKWGHKFTPQINDGGDYARIKINGVKKSFHRVVFFSFGGVLKEDETVDHIDQDKANNTLANLRALNRSGQKDNQTRRPAAEILNDRKHAVEARAVGAPFGTPWERFHGMGEAARQLNARHPDRKFEGGNISQACRKGCKHQGYHFRKPMAS